MFLVGQVLETGKGIIEFFLGFEHHAQVLETGTKRVPPGVLAQHDTVGGPADILGSHDLVGLAALEDAVLVDASYNFV